MASNRDVLRLLKALGHKEKVALGTLRKSWILAPKQMQGPPMTHNIRCCTQDRSDLLSLHTTTLGRLANWAQPQVLGLKRDLVSLVSPGSLGLPQYIIITDCRKAAVDGHHKMSLWSTGRSRWIRNQELESLDPIQSEDRMAFGNLSEGLRLIEKELQI
ncbi:hypothetical protein TNCV_694751 [Trichonephila clavipes]|nr:hypothetical protein TNCV_694751 [Trichonephila clavipes]